MTTASNNTPGAASSPSNTGHEPDSPAGLYFHIPFCRRKCGYCDFYSVTRLDRLPEFVSMLCKEMEMRANRSLTVDTVYLGGGTPSVLSPEAVGRLLESATGHFNLLSHAECSMEVNPGTVDQSRLSAYRDAGINRLTIGVQSFSDRGLAFLGRIHTAASAARTVQDARRAGFGNIGLDLIYGLPGQTETAWREDLARAVALEPEHLSCYMLTFEKGTPLDQDRQEGRITPLEEDVLGRLYEVTVDQLARSGYFHYEISNFAVSPEHVSRHNMKYWTFAAYLGLGPSAHSYRDSLRAWNVGDVDRYIASLAQGRQPEAGRETLSQEQQMIEAVYLGLRMTRGIDIQTFETRFGTGFDTTFGNVPAALEREGLAVREGSYFALTRKGLCYADGVSRRMVEVL